MSRFLQSWASAGSSSGKLFPLDSSGWKIVVSRPRRDWHREVTDKLNELAALGMGWDGYRALPVRFDTAHFALGMLEAICREDAPAPQIVPGTNGDLQVEWHTDNGDVELHVKGPYQVVAWRANAMTGPDGEEVQVTNDFTDIASWIREVTEPAVANAAAA